MRFTGAARSFPTMTRIPRWAKVMTVVALACGAGCMAVFSGLQTLAFGEDFSRDPPQKVFQKVFAAAPPPGVTHLRISGRQYFIKQWVWMRLRVRPEALKALMDSVQADGPLPEPLARQEMRQRWSSNHRYDAVDKQWVGWEQVAQISRPEVYHISWGEPLSGKPGLIWSGTLIVDRKRQLVFIHGVGD
jgi:hypothetical protein